MSGVFDFVVIGGGSAGATLAARLAEDPNVTVALVEAADSAGIPQGDYNGSDRFAPGGVASLVQTNTRNGKRSSTFHAYTKRVI